MGDEATVPAPSSPDPSATSPSPTTTPPPEAPSGDTKSFGDMVDYDKMFATLERTKGIRFSTTPTAQADGRIISDRALAEEIIRGELNKCDGNNTVTTDFMYSATTKLLTFIFSFVQAIMDSIGSGKGLADNLSNSTDFASDRTRLKCLADAACNVHRRFTALGGSFGAAAEALSGMSDVRTPENMPNSFYNQIRDTIPLDRKVSPSLNR